jgi:hypothetical protein
MFMSFNRHDRLIPVSSLTDGNVGAGAAGAGQAKRAALPPASCGESIKRQFSRQGIENTPLESKTHMRRGGNASKQSNLQKKC